MIIAIPMKQAWWITIILCFAAPWAKAQQRPDTTLAGTATLMRDIRSALSAKPVAFQVKYQYADASNPEQIIDSASGTIEMDGANYRCVLENTETIRSGQYMIILFREDKLMYLARTDTTTTGTDMVAMMMSAMETAGVQQMQVKDTGVERRLRFHFREGSPYREVELSVDCAARTLRSVRYLVNTTALLGPGETEVAPGYSPYGIIRADFSGYHSRPPDPAHFAESRYFNREGTAFKPAAGYLDYTIFLGSPNL